jgi:hypothetical protein
VRSAEDLREQIVASACSAVARPGMHATRGDDLETLVITELSFLLFADERADDPRARLRRYGQRGVIGPFAALFGESERFLNEVGLVMAHELNRFGYLEVDHLLSPAQFAELRGGLRERFDEVDCQASEVLADLGEPTFRIHHDAWAYGSEDPEMGWIYLSFCDKPEPTYEPGSGEWTYPLRDVDRLLRFAWTSEGPFEETLALSTFSKLELWGPGWTWNHSWRSGSSAPAGVREQLQEIHDADPSLKLRRPGFAE